MIFYLQILLFLLYGISTAVLITWLSNKRNVSSLYTRKIFHILIFTAAGFVMLYLDIIAVFIYGIIISCIILVAVFKSRTSPLYHALARVSDKAKSKTYVILPLISTALGGTISVLLFGKFSIIGFFVAGWGDGMAELAGKAWGRHKYRVPTWGKKKRYKSVEGTITIFLVGAAAVFTAMILMDIPWEIIFRVVILCSALSALIEAFSPPGTDNFTVQIIASAVAFLLFQSKI